MSHRSRPKTSRSNYRENRSALPKGLEIRNTLGQETEAWSGEVCDKLFRGGDNNDNNNREFTGRFQKLKVLYNLKKNL